MRSTRALRRLLALALMLALTVGGVTASHGAARPGTSLVSLLPGVEGVAAAVVAQERHVAQLLELDGVVGAGVGAGADGVAVVKVYAESALVGGVPATLDGVPVDVEITGRIVASGGAASWFPRPVPTGVSTGHPEVTAGTIGARVTKNGNVYALSNNHVIANSNDASIDDNILQPGPADGGLNPEDTIGFLSEFVPINFAGGDNTIDAAIALSSSGDLGNSTPSAGYGTPSSTTVAAYVGQPVQKYGRTTGLTRGFVDALNVDILVCYEPFGDACLKEAEFVDQIAIVGNGGSNFSNGGDSGSLIVTDDASLNPVGLLFASGGGTSFGNPIDLVLSALGVTIDGAGAPPPPPPPPPSPPPPPPSPPPPPVDETPPETSITSGPSGTTASTSASFSFAANESSTFECNLDAAGWVGCSSPQGYSGLGVGAHTFAVRATDASSNTDPTPASRSWTIEAPPPPPPPSPPPGPPPPPPVDETPPETAITSGPPVITTSTDATLQFTAGEDATFECDLDGTGWVVCTSPQVYANLTLGGHAFSVRATDPSGNVDATPATRSWTVEELPPDPAPPAPAPPAGPPPPAPPAEPPASPTPAETLPAPVEPRRPELFIAVSPAVSPGGTKLADEDIAGYDGSSFVVYFDGSDVGLRRLAIDALAVVEPETILLSFSAPGRVPGVGRVDDSDIVQFDASSLGSRTAGTFSMYFDGSDVGLTRNGEDIDAIDVLRNGRLVISTSGSVRVPGARGADEDLLSFKPSSLGPSTAGRWSRYFDGSDVALDTSPGEDIDGVAVSRRNVFFSTRGAFSVPGLAGADEDVSRFGAKRLGRRTSGRFMPPRKLDGSTVGLRATDVTALDLP